MSVMINIQVMMRAFTGRNISSFIGINRVFGKEPDIGFEQNHHLWRQQKYCMIIDFLMHIKTPAVGSVGNGYECDDAAKLSH